MVGKQRGPGKVGLLGCPGKGLLGSMVHKLLHYFTCLYMGSTMAKSLSGGYFYSHFLKGFIEWAVWDPLQMSIHGL